MVITLRIWFLFSRNPVVRAFAVALLIAATVANFLLVAIQYNIIQYEVLHPQLSSSSSLAWVYVPSLIIHTVLFALKVYRFLTRSVKMETDSLLWGFVKEYIAGNSYSCSDSLCRSCTGACLCTCLHWVNVTSSRVMCILTQALASLVYGVVGLAMVEPSQLSVSRLPFTFLSRLKRDVATQGTHASSSSRVQSAHHVTRLDALTPLSALSWPRSSYRRVELCSVYVLWLQLRMWIQSGYSITQNSAACIGDEAVSMAKSLWKLASLSFPLILRTHEWEQHNRKVYHTQCFPS